MRSKFVKPTNNDKENCYQIDNDFIHEQSMSNGEVLEILDYLRKRSSRCFRWCIEEKLHEALGPEEL
jgi:uncharacterized protein (TIGR04255 family)